MSYLHNHYWNPNLQENLLRYFRLRSAALRDFGKPPRADEQALRLMKNLNVEARTPEGTAKLNDWLKDLETALEFCDAPRL